ncbi:MAG: glycosyltransferase family 4 protein [Nitrospinae bacterium]|nr:glycosyltransferase family 4 protein [Nitrospinota bacterium]
MKILIVSQYFWPENFRINDLAQGLTERGHRVTVLTGQPNYPGGKFFPGYGFFKNLKQHHDGIRILRVPLLPRGQAGGIRLFLNYISFALMGSILGPLLCRGDIDVIFVHEPSPITVGFPAIVLKIIKKAPIIFWVLDLWPESLSATGSVKSQMVLSGVRRMAKFIYDRCDKILVQSRGFVFSIMEMGIPHNKIFYFPSWAEDIYKPLPRNLHSEIPDLPKGFLVMFAGNIGVAQDFPTLLGAAEKLKPHKNIHWIIIGDGRKFEWVKNQVHGRGLSQNVHLLGRYPLETMPYFFSKAGALLVTLKRDPIMSLTIPGKIQSYLASGRPIIAALDGEGVKVIQEAGAGMTSPAESMDGLAEIVLKMSEKSPSELEVMGMKGHEYYNEHFDRFTLFDKLEFWMLNSNPAKSC